jgi:hypothetical protein
MLLQLLLVSRHQERVSFRSRTDVRLQRTGRARENRLATEEDEHLHLGPKRGRMQRQGPPVVYLELNEGHLERSRKMQCKAIVMVLELVESRGVLSSSQSHEGNEAPVHGARPRQQLARHRVSGGTRTVARPRCPRNSGKACGYLISLRPCIHAGIPTI